MSEPSDYAGFALLKGGFAVARPVAVGRVHPAFLKKAGAGSLAGSFPEGITRLEGAPVSAQVRVYWENPKDGSLVLAGSTVSGADGVWEIGNLDATKTFIVRGSLAGHNDVVSVGVTPHTEP